MSMLKIEQENGKHYIIDVNPATLEVIDKVPLESEEEVARKVERARVAF